MIVKCQKSLTTSFPTPRMMFYGYNHQPLVELELTPEWEKRFKNWGPQFFAEVMWNDHDKAPVFVRKRGEQFW